MNEQDLLKYCFFYKGEAIIPPTFDKKNEGKLWVAEKYVCEEIPNLIDKENPRKSIASFVFAYVSKWSPYIFLEVMGTYLQKAPDLKDYINDIYN